MPERLDVSDPLQEPAPAPRVMQLSLWHAARGTWHARLVEADQSVHEFDNPFELARYLAAPPRQQEPSARGLR